MADLAEPQNPFWEPDDPVNTPFEISAVDESIDSLLVSSGHRTPIAVEHVPANATEGDERGLTWEQIASHLLRKNFNLTALELYTELHEKGIQIPRLRDFFSNPGNFESVRDPSSSEGDVLGARLNRASSSQTLDSLDFHREPSDDDLHGRVDERVAVLEFELRKARDVIQNLREHLTSLTGSPEPANSTTPILPKTSQSASSLSEDVAVIQPLERRALNFLINEYLLTNEYKLTSITFTDECQNLDFDDWDDVGLNISKPPGLLSLYRRFRYGANIPVAAVEILFSKVATSETGCQTEDHPYVPSTAPSDKEILHVEESHEEKKSVQEEVDVAKRTADFSENSSRRNSTATAENHMDGGIAWNEFSNGSGDTHESNPRMQLKFPKQLARFSFEMRKTVFPHLHSSDPDNARIIRTISAISLEYSQTISTLADSLPHIIPNVLLAKRQEIIPVLLLAILLHGDHKVRDQLLHQLFNLLKKPEEQQRRMILNGCERFASLASPEKLEGELLPQCWTQISHKYAERRMLVAESCAVLAPYVSPGLCGSLIISMLKQMMTEDKNAVVREKVVQSLSIVCLYIEDRDKFSKLVELLQICLRDPSDLIVKATISLYLPSLALWTQEHFILGPKFIQPYFVDHLGAKDEVDFGISVAGVRKLVPYLYADVVNNGPWQRPEQGFEVDEAFMVSVATRLPTTNHALESLKTLIGDDFVKQCARFQSYIDREWYQEWPQYEWVANAFVHSLCECAAAIHVSKQESVMLIVDLFKHIIYYFGDNFATGCVSRCMKGKIQELGSSFLCHAVFVCFACAVVGLCEPKQLQEFLSSALVSISDQSLPLEGLQLIFKDLSDRFPEDLTQVCWIGIVHHSVPVRMNAARLLRFLTEFFRKTHSHLDPLIAPLVTLASDQESRVRLEIIPSLANVLIEHIQEEKLLTVFQSFLDDKEHLDVVDNAVRSLAKSATFMDKRFHQEFLLPRLAVLVAQNSRLQVYRKDMAVCLLDAYVSISCANFGEEAWLVAPVLQSVRSLLQELKELNMAEYVDIAQELCDKLTRISHQSASFSNPEEIKAKMMTKIKDSGLTTMFKKK